MTQALQEIDFHGKGNMCTFNFFFPPRDVTDAKEEIRSEDYLIGGLENLGEHWNGAKG